MLIQILGWTGTGLIVLAYFFVSIKKIDAESREYQIMNLLGAIGVGIHVFHQRAWPAFTLEIVWGVIAMVVLLKKKRKSG